MTCDTIPSNRTYATELQNTGFDTSCRDILRKFLAARKHEDAVNRIYEYMDQGELVKEIQTIDRNAKPSEWARLKLEYSDHISERKGINFPALLICFGMPWSIYFSFADRIWRNRDVYHKNIWDPKSIGLVVLSGLLFYIFFLLLRRSRTHDHDDDSSDSFGSGLPKKIRKDLLFSFRDRSWVVKHVPHRADPELRWELSFINQRGRYHGVFVAACIAAGGLVFLIGLASY